MMKIGVISLMMCTVVCMTSAVLPTSDKMGTFHGCASVGHSVFNPSAINNILYDECLIQCFGGNFGYESANVCECGDGADTFVILPEEGCGLSICSDEYCGGIFRAESFIIPEFEPTIWYS